MDKRDIIKKLDGINSQLECNYDTYEFSDGLRNLVDLIKDIVERVPLYEVIEVSKINVPFGFYDTVKTNSVHVKEQREFYILVAGYKILEDAIDRKLEFIEVVVVE